MIRVVQYQNSADFLARAEPWLLEREADHNLILSLAYARAAKEEQEPEVLYATLESDEIVGCVMRTPPHKVLITAMPEEAAESLAAVLVDLYEVIPAVLGPSGPAEAVAMAWVKRRGGGWRPGMEMGIYRLTTVIPPRPVPGTLRTATVDDIDLAVEWGEAFAQDTGVMFPTRRSSIEEWVQHERLQVWEVGGTPVCIAVAQGDTPGGARVGYVYTPPEHRGRGYASACVASVSQKVLDRGADFCVLYTDMSNPTSNAIYQRIGYELITRVRDVDLVPEREL
jgi:predicted GNAT family acetyltransferase